MFASHKIVMLALALLIGATMSACSFSLERNEDGTWTATGAISETETQQIIDDGLADPLISNVQLQFHDGYITVTADRSSVDGTRIDALSFRLDMMVVNGHLGVVISDVRLNGEPFDPGMVDVWNQRLANRLERAGQRNPNSTLQAVTITDNEVTMVWHLTKLGRN